MGNAPLEVCREKGSLAWPFERYPSARHIVVYFHCNGVDLGMCKAGAAIFILGVQYSRNPRGTFVPFISILNPYPSFQETIKNPGAAAGFLKRTMVEKNGKGINP